MIADLTGYGVRTLSNNPGRAVRTPGGGLDPFAGIVAYWKLDEVGPGTRTDATGNGFDLADSAHLLSITGKIGLALNSIGAGGSRFVTLADNSNFRAGLGVSWSVAIWGLCNSPGTSAGLVSKSAVAGTSDGEWRIWNNFTAGSGRWAVDVWDTASNYTTFDLLGTYANGTLFNHFVLTFDDTTKLFSVYVNGVMVRSATLLNSVKSTSYPFNILGANNGTQTLGGAADECGYWRRALSQAEVTLLYKAGAGLAYTGGRTLPVSQVWANHVVLSGGAAPSVATVSAIDAFVNGCVSDGTWNLMPLVNVVAPDSLIAAGTPLQTNGYFTWVNHAFVAGDLTVNGLIGNGTSKYFDTGVIPSTAPVAVASVGLVTYVYTDDATTGQMEMGTLNTSPAALALLAHFNDGKAYFECWKNTAGGVNQDYLMVNSPGPGFYSGQRTSNTAFSLYFANSTTAHAALITGSGATQTGALESTYPLYAWASNFGSPATSYTKKRLSFVALTQGMTAAQSALLYARVQALRVAFGGGYV